MIRPATLDPCICGYDGRPATKRVYKYPLSGAVRQKLSLPYGANLFRAAVVQNGTICLYAMVDVDQSRMAEVEVGVLGTGWDVPQEPIFDPQNHLATVSDDGYVWHIFVRAV